MKVCPRCGLKTDDDAKFCPRDGSLLEAATGDPLLGRVLMGQFRILEPIGKGTAGTVYLAEQLHMDRMVAIKVLNPELSANPQVVERFRREAKAVARLSHPNVITVHLTGRTEDGFSYLVMEHVAGKDLDTLLQEEAPLPLTRALRIAIQIAEALGDAHAHGIAHRDLKPANIKISARRGNPDFVKVLDFGIAKILQEGTEGKLTKTGTVFGTPYYVSPEQASGAKVDHRTDLYSLGVIFYRMVTGRLPFESKSGLEVLIKHIREEPPPPRRFRPDLPAEVEAFILKALAKKPEERFQTAEEMALHLRALLDEAEKREALASPRTGRTLDMTGWQEEAARRHSAPRRAAAAGPQPAPSPRVMTAGSRPSRQESAERGIEPSSEPERTEEPATDTVTGRKTAFGPDAPRPIQPPPQPFVHRIEVEEQQPPPAVDPPKSPGRPPERETPRPETPSPALPQEAPSGLPSVFDESSEALSMLGRPRHRTTTILLVSVLLGSIAGGAAYLVMRTRNRGAVPGSVQEEPQQSDRTDAAPPRLPAPSPEPRPSKLLARGTSLGPKDKRGELVLPNGTFAIELDRPASVGRRSRIEIRTPVTCQETSLQVVDASGGVVPLKATVRPAGRIQAAFRWKRRGAHRIVLRCTMEGQRITVWFTIPVGGRSRSRRHEGSGEAAPDVLPEPPAPSHQPAPGPPGRPEPRTQPRPEAPPPTPPPRPSPREDLPPPPDEAPAHPSEDLPPPPDDG